MEGDYVVCQGDEIEAEPTICVVESGGVNAFLNPTLSGGRTTQQTRVNDLGQLLRSYAKGLMCSVIAVVVSPKS